MRYLFTAIILWTIFGCTRTMVPTENNSTVPHTQRSEGEIHPTFSLLPGDKILRNGNILTVDSQFSNAEMMIINTDTIRYVGPSLNLPSSSNTIDLNGKTVLPGLIEPHTHPAASAGLYQWIDVSGFTHDTAQEALQAIKDATIKTPKGEWILCFGWDAMLLEDAQPPYRDILDDISTEHPIWIMMQSMHSHYFNSYAFELAGIDDSIKDPVSGGYYERDDDGQLTGLITESAPLAPILPTLPKTTDQQLAGMMKAMYKKYNSYGITTIGVTGLIDALLPTAENIIQDISQEENPGLRLFLYRIGGQDYSKKILQANNDFFKFLGYKYWSDGSPYTGSMLLSEPYAETSLAVEKLSIDKGSFGHIMLPLPLFGQLVKRDASAGHQISIHAQGDSACVNTLNVMQGALEANPRTDHRFRMEHLALIKEEQVDRMQNLGVTPSFHINHVHYYGDFLAEIVGSERAGKFMPIGWAKDRKVKFSLHNDSPMYPPDPLLAVTTAVTRRTRSGRILGQDLSVSVQDAIRAVTIDAAWQLFAEDEIGSLEIGKKADFIIVDKNPLQISPNKIKDLKIERVYVDGKEVFSTKN